jgi:hypothetical protein
MIRIYLKQPVDGMTLMEFPEADEFWWGAKFIHLDRRDSIAVTGIYGIRYNTTEVGCVAKEHVVLIAQIDQKGGSV